MNASNTEIARVGLCTEGAVRAAVSAKRLAPEDLMSVFGFVVAMRIKAVGGEYLDDVWGLGGIKTGAEMVDGVCVPCDDCGNEI